MGLALRRPTMILHFARAAWVFRARAWYRRAPFLPLPPRSYLRWRLETAYGAPDAAPDVGELERYLRWASLMRRSMRRRVDG